MKCPNCDKELKQTEGKREKKFCNSTCRSNVWAKLKRQKKENKAPKPTEKSEPTDLNEVQERIAEIEKMLLLPQKYLAYNKRTILESELNKLKFKLIDNQ